MSEGVAWCRVIAYMCGAGRCPAPCNSRTSSCRRNERKQWRYPLSPVHCENNIPFHFRSLAEKEMRRLTDLIYGEYRRRLVSL